MKGSDRIIISNLNDVKQITKRIALKNNNKFIYYDGYQPELYIDLNIDKVSSGKYHDVFLTDDNRVLIHNTQPQYDFNQLGINSQPSIYTYFLNTVINNAIDIATGDNHTLILTSDGVVTGIGKNNFNQLGNKVSQPEFGLTDNIIYKEQDIIVRDNITKIYAGSDISILVENKTKEWCKNNYKNRSVVLTTCITTTQNISETFSFTDSCKDTGLFFINNDDELFSRKIIIDESSLKNINMELTNSKKILNKTDINFDFDRIIKEQQHTFLNITESKQILGIDFFKDNNQYITSRINKSVDRFCKILVDN